MHPVPVSEELRDRRSASSLYPGPFRIPATAALFMDIEKKAVGFTPTYQSGLAILVWLDPELD